MKCRSCSTFFFRCVVPALVVSFLCCFPSAAIHFHLSRLVKNARCPSCCLDTLYICQCYPHARCSHHGFLPPLFLFSFSQAFRHDPTPHPAFSAWCTQSYSCVCSQIQVDVCVRACVRLLLSSLTHNSRTRARSILLLCCYYLSYTFPLPLPTPKPHPSFASSFSFSFLIPSSTTPPPPTPASLF